jgi:hypothetical protein
MFDSGIENNNDCTDCDTADEREDFFYIYGVVGVSGSNVMLVSVPVHDLSSRRLYGIAGQRHILGPSIK